MKEMEMRGYGVWIEKGALVVLNSYGYQVVIIGRQVLELREEAKIDLKAEGKDTGAGWGDKADFGDTDGLYKEYQRWIRLI